MSAEFEKKRLAWLKTHPKVPEIPPNELGSYLVLKPSKIHGQGVFTLKDIPEGTIIGEFKGIKMTVCDFEDRWKWDLLRYDDTTPFSSFHILVSKTPELKKENILSYLNDGRYKTTPPSVNSCFHSGKLRSLRNIAKGEELLIDYGHLYWELYERNLEVLEVRKSLRKWPYK